MTAERRHTHQMARHTVKLLIIGRSDGKRTVENSKSRQKEDNQPTKAQLQKTVDSKGVQNYYQAVKIGHPKSMEWRKKLGGMLMNQLGKPYDTCEFTGKVHIYTDPLADIRLAMEYCLADFPENYRLYEHCRIMPEALKSEKEGSKYPNERRDYYLYGHPGGRKKRFRSPADFLPHLLWMSTDQEGDPENCECKLCTSEDFLKLANEYLQWAQREGKTTTADRTDQRQGKQTKAESAPIERGPKADGASAVANMMRKRSLSISQEKAQSPVTKVQQSTSAAPIAPSPTPQLAAPTQLPIPKNYEQDVDAQCNKFLYRPGEVVWFSRGSSWGLSVITARQLFKDQRHQDRPEYTVQPLSHPYTHPPMMKISQEDLLRPWLAWSAPNATHQALINAALTYETIDWRSVVHRLYGPGDPEVDGSIFAAKFVDGSYTPFEPLESNRPQATERVYNGVYLGGEKIWVGEAVRLRTGSEKDIMILHHIVEGPLENSSGTTSQEISVVGDIYTFETVAYNPKRSFPNNPYLPIRVSEDLNYRNRITIAHKSQISYWKLTQPSARLNLGEVKGRWYESRVLLPIVQGQTAFAQALSRGDISDVGDKLNGRGDSTNNARKLGTRKASRLEALGAAVPPGTVIGPRPMNAAPTPVGFPMDPALMAATQVNMDVDHTPEPAVNDTDMSEFVDVNQLEEGDYNQAYLGNLGTGGQF